MDSEGWPTLNAWLAEYKRQNNTSMLMEMLELLQKLPVTIAALKKVCVRMQGVGAVYVYVCMYVCMYICMCHSKPNRPDMYVPVHTANYLLPVCTDINTYVCH